MWTKRHHLRMRDGDFLVRSKEISRVEGLSDAVFGFAITLLVVSLEVPKSFHDLMTAMRGFLTFAVCFTLLFQVWWRHYRFFRGVSRSIVASVGPLCLE